jgi:beta-glucosidase
MSQKNIYEAPLPLYLPLVLKGSATASHQVNGSPGSNWDEFERSQVRIKELTDVGKDPINFIAGDACHFETKYYDDFKHAQRLGHNAIRFSINWATVEPRPGKFDRAVLVKYQSMVHSAIAIDLEPVITLYHWTHPGWFEAMGGWKHAEAPRLFARFIEEVLKYIGKNVRWYTVFNEPKCYLPFSYRWAKWPPRESSEEGYRLAFDHMVWAHRYAHAAIKRSNPDVMVGIGEAAGWMEYAHPSMKPETDDDFEFTDRIRSQLDFIGVQTYMHSKKDPDESKNRNGWDGHDPCVDDPVRSDMPWGMCPRLAYEVVKKFADRYPGMPLIVTEHGHADSDMSDNRRCWYIWESLKWLSKAIDGGTPLIGYLHWSLLRNFEWAFGWEKDFGLIHVDLKTQKRTVRTSALLLKDIFEAGALTQEIADKYAHVIKHPHSD